MKIESRVLSVALLMLAVGAVNAAEPKAQVSDVQKRLTMIEHIKVTAQKTPSAHSAPPSAIVRKALDAAAAAESKK